MSLEKLVNATIEKKELLEKSAEMQKGIIRKEEKEILTPPSSPAEVDGHESGSRRRGRLKVKRERAKAYKRIYKLVKISCQKNAKNQTSTENDTRG